MSAHRAAYTGNAAAPEEHQMGGKERSKKSQIVSCRLVSLFLLSCTAFFFIFSVTVKREGQANNWKNKHYELGNTNDNIPEQKQFEGWRGNVKACNYSDGRWVQDAKIKARYSHKCKEIFKGWNCIANNKSNARDILQWRWQPWGCDLPRFDPVLFLEHFRDNSIGNNITLSICNFK
ncbi:hypothetical protein KI387_022796 [Taxus chinensis]|uniref:Trichome birefringence-like N-terminal domain-containing protein n=1 Tax=Taxus chinensis TaxID=29808 RepID=A0AA38G131_TAXCH|nr:hypothetical protein KI387_022796 [Taxus chinensis]